MEFLSDLQIKILNDLVVFKQLTIPQLTRLNKDVSSQSIRRSLNRLYNKRKPYVKRVEFKKISHFGKLSYVYSLSTVAGEALQRRLNSGRKINTFTPENPRLTDDYFHRVWTIDFQILMFESSLNGLFELHSCFHYFVVKKAVSSFISINKIHMPKGSSIIPDLVAKLGKGGKGRWIMFELHNGDDKSRIKEQIKQHALCLTGLHAHGKYKIPKERYYYILIVFEMASVKKSVIKDLSSDVWYSKVSHFFLTKSITELDKPFLENWTDISGQVRSIKF